MKQSTNSSTSSRPSLLEVVGVVADGQTYRNLLYLLLAFPLGVAYFVVLTVGLALGLGLAVLVVGLGILVVTVIGLRFIAAFERTLANALLGTDIADPDDVERGDGLVGAVEGYLRAPSTWRGLGFVLLKFWLGILALVLLVALLGTAVELLLLPAFPEGVLNTQVLGWTVSESFQTATQRAIAVPLGVVLGFVALHVLNAVADVNASVASALLGPSDSTSLQTS